MIKANMKVCSLSTREAEYGLCPHVSVRPLYQTDVREKKGKYKPRGEQQACVMYATVSSR